MRTNADVTVYSRGVNPTTRSETWEISHVTQVVWEENKAANVSRSGLLESDRVTVYIPIMRREISVKAGDVLVRGLVYDAIVTGFAISDLKAKYPASATVRSVDRMDRGSQHLRHWRIGAT